MRGQPSRSGPRPPAVDAAMLAGVLRPVTEALGADLEEVRVTSVGRRRLIRVVVDADGGVSLDEITSVSQRVCAALDSVPELGQVPYTVEVTSPGVDRPLTEPRHWRRAAGRLVTASGGVTGRVVDADDERVRLDIDGETRELTYAELGAGKVQVEFS